MKVYGIPVEGIPVCALCLDPNAGTPMSREYLQDVECKNHSDLITFTSPCRHQGAGFDAEYCKKHGTLTLVCHECHKTVNTFKIART